MKFLHLYILIMFVLWYTNQKFNIMCINAEGLENMSLVVFNFDFLMHMSMCVCISLYAWCHEGKKRTSDHLGLELHMVVTHSVGART